MPNALADIKAAVLACDEDATIEAATACIREGVAPIDAINAMGDALREIGDLFQRMDVFLPEVLLSTEVFKAGLTVLGPELMKHADTKLAFRPKVVICTVKGDVHAVGKDLVATMMTVAGFDVKNLGADVDSDFVIQCAEDFDVQIIGLSSLMSTTVSHQKEVIDRLKARGIREKFKVIVGGGSTTPQWAEQIGSDGYSRDAVEAVELSRKLLGL